LFVAAAEGKDRVRNAVSRYVLLLLFSVSVIEVWGNASSVADDECSYRGGSHVLLIVRGMTTSHYIDGQAGCGVIPDDYCPVHATKKPSLIFLLSFVVIPV
jgi:hypothetical protein